MKRLLLALALLLVPAAASAQCNGVFANNTVCGNVTGAGNLPRPTSPAAFLGAAGGTNGQTQYNNGGALGGYTPSGDVTVNSSTGVETIQPGVVNSGKIATGGVATTNIANNAVTNGKLATNALPIYASRAAAAALDLSAFTAVTTLGYATPGDGGGANFVKVNATFLDTYITAGTIAGGTLYTNGTYLGVPMGGGTGLNCSAKVTVAGGSVTAVDLSGGFCNGYTVGDVLTPLNSAVGGTGSGATFTVTTISSPTGSFTDSAANKWQIAVSAGNVPNARQFGMKGDWNGTDGSATNDLAGWKSAMAFMSTAYGSSSAYIYGGTIVFPKGAYYFCASPAQFATLQVPNGVIIKGVGVQGGTTFKQCSAADSNEHFVSLCDPNLQFGAFGCALRDIALEMTGSGNSGVAAVYSNSGQQFPLLDTVYIQPNNRGCVKYEIGKGGAANAIFNNVDCEQIDSATNPGFSGNSSGTQIKLMNWVFGCAPGICGASNYAINMVSGNFVIDTIHVEQHQNAINAATTSASHLSTIRNLTLDAGCVNGITLTASNPNNTVLVENVENSCSTWAVFNGHGGGTSVSGNIMAARVFNP